MPGAPATAARHQSCETRPEASGVTISVFPPHKDGAGDIGAIDPPYNMVFENPELQEDGVDEVIEDDLSHSNIRDIRSYGQSMTHRVCPWIEDGIWADWMVPPGFSRPDTEGSLKLN